VEIARIVQNAIKNMHTLWTRLECWMS